MGIAYIYVVPAAPALLLLDSAGGTVHEINNLICGNTGVFASLFFKGNQRP
jgi:hypothetical protein